MKSLPCSHFNDHIYLQNYSQTSAHRRKEAEHKVIKLLSNRQSESMWAVTLQITILFNSVSLVLCSANPIGFPEVTYQVFGPRGPIQSHCMLSSLCLQKGIRKKKRDTNLSGYKQVCINMCRSVSVFVLYIKRVWCCTLWYFAWLTLAQRGHLV